jgi:hypothetical protein
MTPIFSKPSSDGSQFPIGGGRSNAVRGKFRTWEPPGFAIVHVACRTRPTNQWPQLAQPGESAVSAATWEPLTRRPQPLGSHEGGV